MGKNKKGNPKHKDLGRTLIKDKNARQGNRINVGGDSWRHTTDLQDGYDWNRINLQSVTEQDTLDEFLDTAEMAGVEFTAEKLNIKIVGTGSMTGVLGEAEKNRIKNLQDEHRKFITIPRRPPWDESTSPEQLEQSERDSFLNWRRGLAHLQEKNKLMLTPYEKNLDVWRQLWRVIERCDVICQIVDARNPLLYKCDDLEVYVKEIDPLKEFIVLINKADYLTEKQRLCWVEYFTEKKTKVIFWSALEELTLETASADSKRSTNAKEEDELDLEELSSDEYENSEPSSPQQNIPNIETTSNTNTSIEDVHDNYLGVNSTKLLSRSELLQYFKIFKKVDNEKCYAMIGLVGYPNVGKSSTINALMQEKKTAVSATPGKTKHFQTHFLDDELCLCDCPGLVFPSFVFTKAHLTLNGILPVDQMRDHIGPVDLLVQHIPRKVIESTYGINIAKPNEMEDSTRPPTAEEVLSSYAKMRGFMTSSGVPDCPRASRYIMKDYLKGKLLYCHPPPGSSGANFEQSKVSDKVLNRIIAKEEKESLQIAKVKIPGLKISSIDEDFFSEKSINAHYKTPTGAQERQPNENLNQIDKPWKKHNNRNKKEKLRRVYNEC